MVYDRERKGPALIGTDWATDLTMQQAEDVKRMLIGPTENKAHSVNGGRR